MSEATYRPSLPLINRREFIPVNVNRDFLVQSNLSLQMLFPGEQCREDRWVPDYIALVLEQLGLSGRKRNTLFATGDRLLAYGSITNVCNGVDMGLLVSAILIDADDFEHLASSEHYVACSVYEDWCALLQKRTLSNERQSIYEAAVKNLWPQF